MYNVKPIIKRPNGKTKSGRGFSPDEIAKAGITCFQAKQMGLPVDFRRKSIHESNIETLTRIAATPKQTEA
ncbi:MAG: ribosomal protein L13e [Nitrososphaerota archaeon]|jgi:large subunit ribosomal protein L13e|uniref:ribosomal protein L13e n=1 Tax=Candidatus Bathycorpusculum sp. TaxID=2994959 RepID=UPI0028329E55|nr:ribosomal protein L13e [Candidatus Termiticorpusculum sp.]MCL2257054.1 ribosomal protein L13e [Candidatus Termiticorpusculum sp.]MCL2292820.1 ribosomal protein L13e [Candidatus Termiticorpusculum sp.]MDR0460589.1 ribosomal protein L13e [Nitrososphaerota archaeon]